MGPDQDKLIQQIQADLKKVPSSSLADIALFIKNVIKKTIPTDKKIVSLYGFAKSDLKDEDLEKGIKQSRSEIVEALEEKIKRWTI